MSDTGDTLSYFSGYKIAKQSSEESVKCGRSKQSLLEELPIWAGHF